MLILDSQISVEIGNRRIVAKAGAEGEEAWLERFIAVTSCV